MHTHAQVNLPEDTGALPAVARSVTMAAEWITLAMQEAQQPVELLGASVSRIIVTLGSLRRASEGLADPEQAAQLREQINSVISTLSLDVAQATETLQFYDRMSQQLMLLRDHLAGMGGFLAGEAVVTGSDLPSEAVQRSPRSTVELF